ncbi:MAG: hypothetical protein ACYTG3_20210 [Planctomycetota bacterium]|jgi:hypothetical protein
MKRHILEGRWAGAFLLVALALCIIPAAPAFAGEKKNGPVFLILSLEKTFDIPADITKKSAKGSDTVIVEIGEYVAGDDIEHTRFKPASSVKVKLPKKIKFSDLDQYQYTILGAFDAPNASVHLISPDDGTVPRKVQEAFFLASPLLTEEFERSFPSTVEISQFIYDTAVTGPEDGGIGNPDYYETDHTQGGTVEDERGPALTAQQIVDNIFQTESGTVLDAPEDDVYAAEADGDLFPHQPSNRVFAYDFSIDADDDTIATNMAIDVAIDLKPGNKDNVINNDDDGVVWAAVLTTEASDGPGARDFNAQDIDVNAVYLSATEELFSGSKAKDYKVEDVDHDGDKDVTFKFDVADIGLTTSTTKVFMTGLFTVGSGDSAFKTGFTGEDDVTVK